MSNYKITYSNELYHFGIKGQKWGQRRFQNDDGSLTAAGRERYGGKNGSQSTRDARANMAQARIKKKQAWKEYSKSFDKATRLTNVFRSKEANKQMEDDLFRTAKDADAARAEYKNAKKAYKESKKADKAAWKTQVRDYKKSEKLGEKVARNLLLGPSANKAYVAYRASGQMSAKKAAIQVLKNDFFLGPAGNIIAANSVKQQEIRKK